MRSLTDVDQQISANFRARLFEVLDQQPAARIDAGLARLRIERESLIASDADAAVPPLSEILHTLNEPGFAPGIALRFGLARRILDLGLVGYAALSCSDIGSALNVIFRYHALTSAEYDVHMLDEGDTMVFRQWIRPVHASRARVIGEEFATGFWQVVSELIPPSISMSGVRLEFDDSPPPYARLYAESMPCDITFGADRTSVAMPAAWRALPIQTADATVEQVCRAECDQLLAGLDPGHRITEDVRRLIVSVPSNRPQRLEDVARAMMMSTRTLERRLHTARTSFREIDLEVRMELATQYLELGSLTGQEISNVLGYSRPSAFFRAFKSWFGMTPSEFRAARHRATDAHGARSDDPQPLFRHDGGVGVTKS